MENAEWNMDEKCNKDCEIKIWPEENIRYKKWLNEGRNSNHECKEGRREAVGKKLVRKWKEKA